MAPYVDTGCVMDGGGRKHQVALGSERREAHALQRLFALNSGSRWPAGGSVGLEWVLEGWDLGLALHISPGLNPTFRALQGLGP